MEHIPTARRDGLVVRELEDETLVYDLQTDEAHCLNQTAAMVWKHCDGRMTVEEIATVLGNDLPEKVDAQIVWLALAQLRRKRLLTGRISRVRPTPRISRRELVHKLAKAALIALPLVTTIAAPRPASAGSCSNCGGGPTAECCGSGCPCQGGMGCCSGVCSAGICN